MHYNVILIMSIVTLLLTIAILIKVYKKDSSKQNYTKEQPSNCEKCMKTVDKKACDICDKCEEDCYLREKCKDRNLGAFLDCYDGCYATCFNNS
jgi:uncharacterized paraquat-inducible protein A